MRLEEIMLRSMYGSNVKFIQEIEGGHLIFEVNGERIMFVTHPSEIPMTNIDKEVK
jgi:hypothetical protein